MRAVALLQQIELSKGLIPSVSASYFSFADAQVRCNHMLVLTPGQDTSALLRCAAEGGLIDLAGQLLAQGSNANSAGEVLTPAARTNWKLLSD